MSDDRSHEQAGDQGMAREETAGTHGGMVATAFGRTDIGCQRTINQDTLGHRVGRYAAQSATLGLLYAVADGMGGHARGEVASALAIEHFFARYYASDVALEPRQALAQALIATNSAVHEAGRGDDGKTMGTTLTAVLLRDNILYVGNIGDSRTYLIRGSKIKQLSEDHSLIGEQVRVGLLTEAQARTSTIRNVITRAVGYREAVEPDTFAFTVAAGDVLLLCSDGLHGQVENEELAHYLSTQPLKAAVDGLIALARERGGPDNITAMTVRIDQIGERGHAERDEQTSEVTLGAASDASTGPRPPRRAGDTDEIVTDELPTIPAAAAALATAPPLPPIASDPNADTQPLLTVTPPVVHASIPPAPSPPPPPIGQAVPPPPASPPPPPAVGQPALAPPIAPPPTIGQPPPARRGGPPLWLLALLPLLLIGLVGAGVVAVGAVRRASSIGNAQPASSVVAATAAPAAPTATIGAPPTATVAAVLPSTGAAPPNLGGGVPTATRPAQALLPAPPLGASPGQGANARVTGVIVFVGEVRVPERFAEEWQVLFFDRAERQRNPIAAQPVHQATISATPGEAFAFSGELPIAAGEQDQLTFEVEVRRQDGTAVATSAQTELSVSRRSPGSPVTMTIAVTAIRPRATGVPPPALDLAATGGGRTTQRRETSLRAAT